MGSEQTILLIALLGGAYLYRDRLKDMFSGLLPGAAAAPPAEGGGEAPPTGGGDDKAACGCGTGGEATPPAAEAPKADKKAKKAKFAYIDIPPRVYPDPDEVVFGFASKKKKAKGGKKSSDTKGGAKGGGKAAPGDEAAPPADAAQPAPAGPDCATACGGGATPPAADAKADKKAPKADKKAKGGGGAAGGDFATAYYGYGGVPAGNYGGVSIAEDAYGVDIKPPITSRTYVTYRTPSNLINSTVFPNRKRYTYGMVGMDIAGVV
jgi:hypothetical protein